MHRLTRAIPRGKQNVPAGTVVTQDVTARTYENFYIVSQRGLLGSAYTNIV